MYPTVDLNIIHIYISVVRLITRAGLLDGVWLCICFI